MSTTLVSNCPRCGTEKITFDLLSFINIGEITVSTRNIKRLFECSCVCRHCGRTTIFEVIDKHVNQHSDFKQYENIDRVVEVREYINITHMKSVPPPDHLPEPILTAFKEAAKTHAIFCWNASGCMFRSCIDLASKDFVIQKTKRSNATELTLSLKQRLDWLFKNDFLDPGLEDLATCIREDGNDAAHDVTLTEIDSQDLLEFTERLLTTVYTEPKKLAIAKDRRRDRRQSIRNDSNEEG